LKIPPYTGFIYYRTDHLGNIREVWHASSKTTIQRTQYYPSGLPWAITPADNLTLQPYKYNGKEFVEMNGYDGLDYGARVFFPDRGNGSMTVDPLAEKYYSISPYVYCADNPVNAIDPTGMDMDWFENVISGDVYYNPNMHQGDEKQLGTDWSFLGKDGMFGENDQALIMNNANKAKTNLVQESVTNPKTGDQNTILSHTAMFEGKMLQTL
jgi:RHS repeat-associated protein